MALIKNEIPILEYDTEEKAVLMPGERWNYEFTERVVGQLLFTADSLANMETHDGRNWGNDHFAYAMMLAFDAALEI